jgi:hypothetical protein
MNEYETENNYDDNDELTEEARSCEWEAFCEEVESSADYDLEYMLREKKNQLKKLQAEIEVIRTHLVKIFAEQREAEEQLYRECKASHQEA